MLEREQQRFAARHPRSAALYARGREVYLYGTPLHWMQLWPGAHPVYMRDAQGAHLRDVDGNEFVDLCLGDTGSMFGHSHPAIADAIARQAHRGVTAMLPAEDGVWVGEELSRRFGLPYWHHERLVRLVEFNDIEALERELAHGDVACVITEPMMTNIGMVPVAPGYHDALRQITRRHGTLLLIDETHTISMTDANYAHMIEMATRIARSVEADIARHALPWHVTQIGARAEYMFMPLPPRNGSEAKAGRNGPLEAFIHLYLLNRGVLITPFHNMMLACPQLASNDVE
ncbi:aminotransferase class III-fold pyridoxal phosphate-dependent enzyme [Paraburkholderia sp. J63]|uniref:aminotransferase class III-fold pyridoxal phosphate-dependent enzyme n=1 Tax=Paraburkholderia sp. J63 TaxID=2805434 RepID=UPI002ABE7459|nr:aminotransferase class III-fold pyridoxal phosphate-dependent enzyme [Paraburkholderia sp. J63]